MSAWKQAVFLFPTKDARICYSLHTPLEMRQYTPTVVNAREYNGRDVFKSVMGSAGADVRRLDAGTSSSPDSVRFLGQSAISRMSEVLLFEIQNICKG